jgi:uncharacterized damage-inducible protein DinB
VPTPPLAPDEQVATGSEREVLEAFLDFHRGVVVRKLTGVTEEQARARLVPSLTTLAGLVRHLTGVERHWFQAVCAQVPRDRLPANNRGDDPSWQLGPDDTVERLVHEYEEACAQSRATAARYPLDHAVPHHRLGTVSLRWIYVHMVEETARHAGHADILRELIDGATGVDG